MNPCPLAAGVCSMPPDPLVHCGVWDFGHQILLGTSEKIVRFFAD